MFCGASVELKTCNAALLESAGKSWNEVLFYYLAQLCTLISYFKCHLVCLLCYIIMITSVYTFMKFSFSTKDHTEIVWASSTNYFMQKQINF